MYRKIAGIAAIVIVGILLVVLGLNLSSNKKHSPEKQKNDTQLSSVETETETETVTESKEKKNYPEIRSEDKIKNHGTVVAIGDSAYELYTYIDKVADNYAKGVNKVADNLKGKADVYDMVVPLSSEIVFPDNLRGKIKSSDQREAMLKIQKKMDQNVKTVDIYDALMQHRDEYVYFRTDHHWTTLGAYYAYTVFCNEKGIEPEALDSYKTKDFEGFVGSFYNDTGEAKLKEHPDTVTAYFPNDESTLHVTASDGSEYEWPVIYDVTNYGESLKYSTFIASDNPITKVENKDLNDGSTCVVVKESFGNALVPFLVDHYQTIYVIDYRYWSGSISKFALENKAEDVLFINNVSMIRNKSLVGKLYRVL